MGDPRAPAAPAARWGTVRGRWSRATAHPLALWVLAAIVAALSWPVTSLDPSTGLDPSWMLALHMGARQGLDFGRDVVFTYGPLGFLRVPVLAYLWTARLAFLAVAASQFALCAALIWGLRRMSGSLVAAALGTLVLAPLLAPEPLSIAAMAAAVALVTAEPSPRASTALAAALGALAAYGLLTKLNSGVVVAALGAIAVAVAGARRRSLILAWVATLVVGFLVGWLAAGQSPGAMADYLRNSVDVISGYSEAMGLERTAGPWVHWAAGLVTGVGVFVVVRTPASRLVRLALLALWAVLTFTAFKEGFVRHAGSYFFLTALGGLIMLPLRSLGATSATFAVLLALMPAVATTAVDPGSLVAPVQRPRALADQLLLLADGQRATARIETDRRRMSAAYAVPASVYAALRPGGVAVDPYEVGAAWALRLPWHPIPVFQSYSAYTQRLDAMNASALAAPSGPQRVLRQRVAAVDGRNDAWESPAARLALLCHFKAVATAPPWQALARVPNRCGRPRPVSSVRSTWGRTVAVPPAPAGSVLTVQIHGAAVTGAEKLRTLAYRAVPRSIAVNGGQAYRLVPGTAADGLILAVPRSADFPPPFSLDQRARSLVLHKGPDPQPDTPLVFDFLAVPVR